MKQPLKENGGLPASILWTLAIVAGISVANIYYVQPLLNMIRHELGISEFRTNLIAMVTQIGYAAGLLFITPLGDLYQRKKIILANFLVLIFSLLTIALAHNIHVILVASFLTGACSMIPQIFIPMAAQFSRPEHKGRNVGIVLSGLLTGILASRVVSGFVGELFGWREMYYIAAGMMFVCAVVVLKVLPNIQTNFRGKYSDLMKSLLALVKEFPQLRIYSIRAALNFGSLLAMWSCLAFKMGQAPFFANSDVIGMLGLCGVAGALTASFVGRYVKRVGVRRFNFIGCGLILLSWLLFFVGENTYAGIIAGIIILLKEILWCDRDGHYVQIHTDMRGVLRYRVTIAFLEAVLSAYPQFLPCYRGLIINMDRVRRMEELEFLMDTGERVPFRKRDHKEIKSRFSQYMFRRARGEDLL